MRLSATPATPRLATAGCQLYIVAPHGCTNTKPRAQARAHLFSRSGKRWAASQLVVEPPLQLLEQLVSTHALLLRTHLDVLAQQLLHDRGYE